MCKLRWYGIILNFEVFFIEINDVNINVRFNFFYDWVRYFVYYYFGVLFVFSLVFIFS